MKFKENKNIIDYKSLQTRVCDRQNLDVHSFLILGTLGILFCCPFLKHAVSSAGQLGLERTGFLHRELMTTLIQQKNLGDVGEIVKFKIFSLFVLMFLKRLSQLYQKDRPRFI